MWILIHQFDSSMKQLFYTESNHESISVRIFYSDGQWLSIVTSGCGRSVAFHQRTFELEVHGGLPGTFCMPSLCFATTTVPAQKESLVWQGIPARGKGCWQNSISIQKARAISCSGRSGNLQPSCLLIPTLAKKVSGCSLTFLFLLSCAILICLLANPSTSFLCISAKNWKALLASSCLSICSH